MFVCKYKDLFCRNYKNWFPYYFSHCKLASNHIFKSHPQTTKNQNKSDYVSYFDDFICITDGAIGWKDFNSSFNYAKLLSENIYTLYKANKEKYITNLEDLIFNSMENISENGEACCLVLIFDPKNSKLCSYKVGDCDFLIMRMNEASKKLEIIHSKKEIPRSFNKSFCLSYDLNKSSRGKLTTHSMKPNDIVISGSDGLFDNLYDEDILKCLEPFTQYTEKILDLELVAEIIANKAFEKSGEITYLSPFAKTAADYFVDFIGGKQDDISVTVSQIT